MQGADRRRRPADARSAAAVFVGGRAAGAHRCREDADQRGARGDAAAAASVRPSSPVRRAGASGRALGRPRSRVPFVSGDRSGAADVYHARSNRVTIVNVPQAAFLEELERRVLVCDGAMGTMLYAKGIFLNRSFDELNVTQPELVADVHQAYVRAGADVIETNTFGANRVKLCDLRPGRSHVPRSTCRAHSSRGTPRATCLCRRRDRTARHSHRAMGQDRRRRGARPSSASRRAALLEGGVDLFVLETFRDLNEIGAAIRAVRSVCALPIVAQVTTEDDGNTPRRRAARPVRAGARTARRPRGRPELQRRTGGDARNASSACRESRA